MIGVISKKNEQEVVKEFFQLFKIPWEFYNKNRSYDVVLTTENEIHEADTKLLIIFSSGKNRFDSREHITIKPLHSPVFLECGSIEFPIYRNISTLDELGHPFIRLKRNSLAVGLEIQRSNRRILRVGYDLFQEVLFLLSIGQPPENAHIPTLEFHILMLRNWILDVGIPLVEIPPVPAGYNFITCLTHDVDFVRIRNHRFDHTMLGFVYRALFGSFLDIMKCKLSWKRLFQNWKATFSLPFIYLGFSRDFWLQFDQYQEIERDERSTFFLIPFKNRAGSKISKQTAKRRATKYDITELQNYVKKLVSSGYEIGVHGIDAWHNSNLGHQELNRISQVTGESEIGTRIHWLCFNDHSPRILDNAGFSYDSSFGYNDAVGYRGGTVQPFRPIGVKHMLELPLHIQDTALFFSQRMNLSKNQAWNLCKKLIENGSLYGGILTILWHHRSLAPERLWGDFYFNLLKELRLHNVWFGTAREVIEWFRRRRALTFDELKFNGNIIKLKLKYDGKDSHPPLMLRIYNPRIKNPYDTASSHSMKNYVDFPWRGKLNMEIVF